MTAVTPTLPASVSAEPGLLQVVTHEGLTPWHRTEGACFVAQFFTPANSSGKPQLSWTIAGAMNQPLEVSFCPYWEGTQGDPELVCYLEEGKLVYPPQSKEPYILPPSGYFVYILIPWEGVEIASVSASFS